jgi:hypothetical protein
MDQAPIMPKNWKPSQKSSAPVMPKDWGKEEVIVEKKKPTELASPSEKPTALSVSKSVAPKPKSEEVDTDESPKISPFLISDDYGNSFNPARDFWRPKTRGLPGAARVQYIDARNEGISKSRNSALYGSDRETPKQIAEPAQQNVSVTGSQGKLLIPEKKIKFPAVTEKVTTYKKVPVIKSDDNLPLNPELMLKAIFKNEQGTLGKTTSIKASGGMRNTASGTYQMTDETKRDVFNRNEEFKKQFGDYGSFLKEFNKNPSLEFQAALSHMTDLAKQYGKYALAAWYSPTHAAQAANGNLRALNVVPRKDAGNKMTVKAYYNNAINEYKKLTKGTKSDKDFVKVPVKTEIVKEPAVEVPSLEKFNVLGTNWYGGPVYKEDKPKEVAPKKVGAIEDIYNTFLSSASRFASGLAGLPNAANKAGLMITTKLLGIDDEYNALPVQAKKEIGNIVSDIAQKGGVPSANVSDIAKDYFIKKSDEFSENTNKSDKFINERFGDFFKDPSVDKAADLFLEIPKGFAGSLPYMINPMLGALSAASEQYDKDIKEADGKLGWGQLVNAGVTGVTEYYIEKISNGILNRSVKDAIGVPTVAKDLAKGFVKSVLKDVGMESAGEGLTQFTQSISDDLTKGRDIDWVKTANETIDAAIIGAGIAGGMRTTGAGIGYLAKKVMTPSEKNEVDRNTSAMLDLNSKKGPDNSPDVNAVIDSRIKELDDVNKNIINANIDKVKSMSDDQLKEIVNIDKAISDIYTQRDAVVSNENLDDEEKQSLLDYLKSRATKLNEQKDAIQKQTTSEIPVQPEAGTSQQVAEGEPQAEPQVAAEESEEVTPTITVVDVTTPAKFEEDQMPEMSVDQIDWEASGMGSQQEAIDAYGGINDIAVVDILGKNDKGQYVGNVRVLGQDTSKQGLVVFKDPNAPAQTEEVVEPEVPKTRAEKVKQMLFDRGVYPIRTRVEGLTKLSDENPGQVTAEQVLGVLNVSNTKAQTIATVLNNQVKQEQKQAQQQEKTAAKQVETDMNTAVDTAIENAKTEGLTNDLAAEAGIEALKTTDAYKDADQQQRDLMEDKVRKKAGVKRKAAPSVKKVLGIKPDLVTVNDAVARNEQIRLEIKAAKGAAKAVQEAVDKLVADIKALGQKGKLTPSQTNALLNGLKSNLLNPVIRDQVFARAKRIIENANYAKNVEDANSIRTKIRDIISADKKKPRTNKIAGAVINMANELAKLSPKMVEDIDLYLERANEVLAAIRNPKITDVDVIGRIAADIAAVNDYSKSEFEKQEEARKDEMLAQYEYLVEAGVLDKSMSLKDINKVIAEIMKGDKVDNAKLKEAGLVFYRTLFNDYAEIIKKMLSGTDPITGEPTNISEGDKELVRRFININPDNISDFVDMFNMANAAQEFITNGIIDNMEVMIRHAKGKEEVRKDAANPKMRGYKAILPWVANVAKIPLISNIINTKIAPVQEYLRNVFRGDTNAAAFEKHSGFTDIINGSTKALNESDQTDKSYAETFQKKKPNGKKYFDINNVFERGIFADLLRTTPGTAEEIQAEFVKKKKQLELTIEEKKNSDRKSENREAVELQKAYDKIVKGSKNINDVMSKMAQENIDGVMWWINTWDQGFDKIERASKALYNTALERQNNYTPESWVKIADKLTQDDDVLTRTFNRNNTSYLDTRRAGTLMKYNGAPGLPTNTDTQEVTHIKSYHFDINNSESFAKTLKDVYTAPGMVQYMAYVNSPEFSTIIPDKKTRDNLKEKLAFAINSLKDSEVDISPDYVRDYNKAMKKFVDISRAQALVSIKTPILQTLPVLAGTWIDLVNDQTAFLKGFALTGNMDFHRALNKAGFGISVRGLEAIAALDAAEKRIAESRGVDLGLFNNIAKLGNLELKWMLSKPDIIAARQAWASYYIHKLKKMGINASDIDWNTHEFNEEAADYAERKTNSKLNQNIKELSGEMFASRKQTNRAIRNTILNFASFAYNMKYRFWTDMIVLGSVNSNTTDKADAAKDIVRTVGEAAAYISLGSVLSYWIKEGVYNLIGYEEPEEDKKKADEYLLNSIITRGITDLLSPMPGIGDLLFVKAVNSLLDLAFGEQEKEEPNKEKLFYVKPRPEVEKQFRLYEPPEKSEVETYLSLLGGMSSIYGKNVYDVYKTINLLHEGEQFQVPNPNNPKKPIYDKTIEYKDKFDNTIEFSNKEKEMMKIPFVMQSLGAIGLGFRDQPEAARKVRGSLEKRARKRMAASKKEKLFYVKKAE